MVVHKKYGFSNKLMEKLRCGTSLLRFCIDTSFRFVYHMYFESLRARSGGGDFLTRVITKSVAMASAVWGFAGKKAQSFSRPTATGDLGCRCYKVSATRSLPAPAGQGTFPAGLPTAPACRRRRIRNAAAIPVPVLVKGILPPSSARFFR